MATDRYDVIIIGTGAGGGTLAYRLAPTDGSFFVSSGAVNPALTIMANALRVAQHLEQRLR